MKPKEEKILIANPIYDVVFRYLMEENKVAKLVLSAILGAEIVWLEFNPTESSTKLRENSLTVTRMDFAAKIKTGDESEKLILIELQKAKHYYQIKRFRRYLGKQYMNPDNVDSRGEPLPIFPIYLLGEAFWSSKIPVTRVSRDYWDVATNQKIAERHPFIETLTHDAIVIQIPHLKDYRRTNLERFLSIFDQSNISDTQGHILEIDPTDYPDKYQPVIRRLVRAFSNPKLDDKMFLEDDVLSEFNKLDARVEKEKQKTEAERQKTEVERQRAEAEKQRAEKAEESLAKVVQNLQKSGMQISEIAVMIGKTAPEVEALLKP